MEVAHQFGSMCEVRLGLPSGFLHRIALPLNIVLVFLGVGVDAPFEDLLDLVLFGRNLVGSVSLSPAGPTGGCLSGRLCAILSKEC